MLTKEVELRPHSAEVLASPWFRQEVLASLCIGLKWTWQVIQENAKVDENNLAQMRTFVDL